MFECEMAGCDETRTHTVLDMNGQEIELCSECMTYLEKRVFTDQLKDALAFLSDLDVW